MIRPFKVSLILGCMLVPLYLSGCITEHSSFEQAQQSYAAGNYPRAFRELWTPVQSQDPRAMYAMGYMYYYGIGTNKDQDIGLSLIRASAKWHYPPAVIALRLITKSKYNQYAPLEPIDAYAPRGVRS